MAIDLVYTWVNPRDEEHRVARATHAATEVASEQQFRAGPARFNDNQELEYSLRSARRNLPFLRKIFVVCGGPIPSWLVAQDVEVISPAAIIPTQYRPTFNSYTIEANLFRIDDLSELYIYANDDFFFTYPHQPADFFDEDGRCRISVDRRFMGLGAGDKVFIRTERNTTKALAERLHSPTYTDFGESRSSWLHGRHLKSRLRARALGIPLLNSISHVAQPYLRSAWKPFHELFSKEVCETACHRFRSANDFSTNSMYSYYLRQRGRALFHIDRSHVYLDRKSSFRSREGVLTSVRNISPEVTRLCLNDVPDAQDGGSWGEFVSRVYDVM